MFSLFSKLAKDITIQRNVLDKVEIINKQKIKCAYYTSSNRRFLGTCGKFKNENIGNFTLYATRRDKTVLIQTTDNKKVILTPDRPAKFMKHLKINE
jgi:hypothetical protein